MRHPVPLPSFPIFIQNLSVPSPCTHIGDRAISGIFDQRLAATSIAPQCGLGVNLVFTSQTRNELLYLCWDLSDWLFWRLRACLSLSRSVGE